MNIKDFRQKVRNFIWSYGDIIKDFEMETEALFDNLFEMIKRASFLKGTPENDVIGFPLSAGENIEVSILICRSAVNNPHPSSYQITFRRNFNDNTIGFDSNAKDFNFQSSIFALDVWSNNCDGSNITDNEPVECVFQLYQELWCMEYLPIFFQKHEISYEITYIGDKFDKNNEESAFITFYLPPSWFLA